MARGNKKDTHFNCLNKQHSLNSCPWSAPVAPPSHFYSHEPNEPPHVHIDKDAATAKVWLHDAIKRTPTLVEFFLSQICL